MPFPSYMSFPSFAKRSLARPLALLFAVAATLTWAAPARANGILVTGRVEGGEIQVFRPDRTRRPPERPMQVSLQDHRVTARINGRVAEVTVEQTFRNHTGAQLEGTYLFPLPEGASVSQWSMTMFGRMVEGEIIEAKKAREIYESIVRARRDPGLLEYLGRGLFQARVFPIEPHKDLTIRLTFQQLLPEDGGTIEFRYPLGTERMNATPVANVTMDVQVTSDVDLKAIYSPSHAVDVVRKGDREARVSYERQGRRQDKDFTLFIGRSESDVGFSLQSHKAPGEDGTFLMVLAPKTEVRPEDIVPRDVVFVLDTSGSMAGPKMKQAQEALAYGIRTLSPGDRFNVLGFATGLNPFRDSLQPANDELKEAAVRWVDGLRPAGGTNINDALLESLRMRQDGRLFVVVFLTDGKPTIEERDPDRIVEKVKAANSQDTRIFTFGVLGEDRPDLDVRLLDRVAEATRATRDYVHAGEDIEVVTSRFFRKVQHPVMTDVTIEYGDGIRDVYPRTLPDLFAGSQIDVMGRYTTGGDRTIRLRGKVGDRVVVHEFQASLRQGEDAGYLPRLWAQRKIGYLLDQIRLHGADRELVDEVVRLATRYAIVTPYTAGLVVEESELNQLPVGARLRRSEGRDLGGLVPGSGGRAMGAGAAPAPSSPAPEESVRDAMDSETIERLKGATSEDAPADFAGDDGKAHGGDARWDRAKKVAESVKRVDDRIFHLDAAGRWVDAAWKPELALQKIEAFGKAYFELLDKHPTVARYLALGEKVVFVHEGVAYEIVAAD